MTIQVTTNHRYELAVMLAANRRQLARAEDSLPAKIGRARRNHLMKIMAIRRVDGALMTSLSLVCRELGAPMVDVSDTGLIRDA